MLIEPRIVSTHTFNHSESSQARIDLTAALDESFENSIFNDQQKNQLLDLRVPGIDQYFLQTRKDWKDVQPLKQNYRYRKTLNQWIVAPIGQIQEHKKY